MPVESEGLPGIYYKRSDNPTGDWHRLSVCVCVLRRSKLIPFNNCDLGWVTPKNCLFRLEIFPSASAAHDASPDVVFKLNLNFGLGFASIRTFFPCLGAFNFKKNNSPPQTSRSNMQEKMPTANRIEFHLILYLEDHPRTCKWLGSPPFKSHEVRPFGRCPIQPDPYGTTTITMVPILQALGDQHSFSLTFDLSKVNF